VFDIQRGRLDNIQVCVKADWTYNPQTL